jgi:thiamine-phosphate pyrophosphorylase
MIHEQGNIKMKKSETVSSHKPWALPDGIYGILAEKFSRGRDNVTVARLMVQGGIDVIQYREKRHEKSMQEMYEECLAIRKITREAGIPFIVNDFADLALMVKADGVHVGQDDLPLTALRDLVGDQMIIGCSTHSPEQAEKAVKDGADYIGVGPVFSTQTKEDVCDAVGFSYLNHVATQHTIPFVAIGGIKKDNLADVMGQGARCVCLVTEIVGAEDIPGTIREIKKIYKNSI